MCRVWRTKEWAQSSASHVKLQLKTRLYRDIVSSRPLTFESQVIARLQSLSTASLLQWNSSWFVSWLCWSLCLCEKHRFKAHPELSNCWSRPPLFLGRSLTFPMTKYRECKQLTGEVSIKRRSLCPHATGRSCVSSKQDTLEDSNTSCFFYLKSPLGDIVGNVSLMKSCFVAETIGWRVDSRCHEFILGFYVEIRMDQNIGE